MMQHVMASNKDFCERCNLSWLQIVTANIEDSCAGKPVVEVVTTAPQDGEGIPTTK